MIKRGKWPIRLVVLQQQNNRGIPSDLWILGEKPSNDYNCTLKNRDLPTPAYIEKLDDRELLEYYHSTGNSHCLGVILERYSLLVFGVCMKYLKDKEEAKDAVQQIFLKVLGELQKYKVDYFKSWLYRVAQNHCLMQLRRKGIPDAEINEQLLSAPEEENLQLLMEKEKQLNELSLALTMLNPEQQQCINLFYLKKKSYNEIAAITGFEPMQVKSHIQNGKRNLRNLMKRAK